MADTIREVFMTDARPKDESPYGAWKKEPNPERLRDVISELSPTIDSAVNNYVGQNSSPTVRHRAKLIAADAINTFDPKRGAQLKTHVYNQLRALQRMAPQITDPFPAPERFRQHQNEIYKAHETLMSRFGREPTDEEISAVTKLPAARVTKVRNRARAKLPMSVYEEATNEDDSGYDVIGSEHTDEDDWRDAVYHDLGDVDKLIMMYRSGYRGAEVMDNNTIAHRLNLTPAAVSQRAKRIQAQLDEFNG